MRENLTQTSNLLLANIAVNRFGYGARSGEIEKAILSPKEWVKSQITNVSFDSSLPSSNDIFIEQAEYQKIKKQLKKKELQNSQNTNKMLKNYPRLVLKNMSIDVLQRAITSSHSVSWRLLDFFSNHFSVSRNGRLMAGLAATLEREAIAPNMLGNFGDLLLAVEQHPAMLIYLNNEKSFGPNSQIAIKRNKGLNENLAREILELHTLGADGGYSQTDVIELAKAITGWSVKRPSQDNGTGFIFRPNGHEPNSRVVLGKKYPQKGLLQGQEILRDLAVQPATAKYICFKLAHHFIGNNPERTLLEKMENVWMSSQGNITKVMHALIDSDESWQEKPQKFKTPREFIISTYRALSVDKIENKFLLNSLVEFGQEPFNAGSPAGYSDDYKDWLGGSSLMARIDWSSKVAQSNKRINIDKIINSTFSQNISRNTYQAIMRAESREQALTLFLMSPEFQWR